MDLVNKFWNFCHTLRHDGIDYSDYIEELTYFLFLKLAEEKGVDIPKGCKWDDLIKQPQEKLLLKYNEILITLSKQSNILGDIFRQPIAKIRNGISLRKLLTLIDNENWGDYNEDVLGAMFEGLLEKAANESKKGAGQYFTPRPLIEAIVRVMKPDPLESQTFKVADVACGTGGFLISSYEYWKKNLLMETLTLKQKKKIFQSTYYGQELVLRPRRMAQMNLYLHGIEPNIFLGDTIYEPLRKTQFSCILTNPPFGIKGANQIPERNDFKVKTSNKQLNFVQHIISCLEDFGRAAIVLPDNVLFEDKASDLWKDVMKFCNVHTIMRLPRGTFSPYAPGVKANVIFLQKGEPTKFVWIFDARNKIEMITKRGRPLLEKHFREFESCYGNDPNGKGKRTDSSPDGRFRKFTIKEIANRGYNLDITWLQDDSSQDSDITYNPKEALGLAITKLELVNKDLKSIVKLLTK